MPEIGQTILHYRVVEKIGAGGMGEVYLADDLSLDRRVALKFLPDVFTGDSERMARFEREARLLASLNHPNIAAIYGLEQAEGKRFIVMEFAEGETLAQRLRKGRLPVEEALGICRQIAEGLDAAHEKGIIHRDLKPANVMITEGERVKVLDFGLAKAFSDEIQSVDSSQSPTLTEAMTRPGVILGSAAYMSPEQAKGKSVDKRADIWAFGCILYECLTGKRVFEGETVTETLAAILKGEPEWDKLPAATPPNIRFILQRCLEKSPKRRLRDIGDVILESAPVAFAALARQSISKQPLVWALMFIAAASMAYALLNRPAPAPATVARLTISLPPGQELAGDPAISPDGQTIAYIARIGAEEPQLYLRNLNSFQSRAVPGSSSAEQPFFSPDGRWIAFFAQGQLQKAAVAGGSPVAMCDAASPFGGTWNEDDTIIFTAGESSGLLRVPAAGGKPESLTKPDGGAQGFAHVWPQSLPGGRSILFIVWGKENGGDAVLSLDTRRWQFVRSGFFSMFVPSSGATGHLLSVDSRGGIKAAPFDPTHPELKSADTSVLTDVYFIPNRTKSWLAVSKNGTAIYGQGNPTKRSLVWVDRDGKADPLVREQAWYRQLSIAPDGSRALVFSGIGSSWDIWIYDLQRSGIRTRLTLQGTAGGVNFAPIWSRDGKHVYFSSSRGGDLDIYSQPADGSELPKVLLKRPYEQDPVSVVPDGTLLFSEWHPTTGTDILALSSDGKITPIRVTSFNELNPVVSPNGHWIAYSSNESGRYEIYILDYPGRTRIIPVSTGGGNFPLWSHNGEELFYMAGNAMMAVTVRPDGSIVSAPQLLFDCSDYVASNDFAGAYDVSPDGKRFLMIRHDPDWAPHQLNVILNWFDELKQQVPLP
jgi:Tol biopolymer transport system component/predicted Ser/Thr protein kinase